MSCDRVDLAAGTAQVSTAGAKVPEVPRRGGVVRRGHRHGPGDRQTVTGTVPVTSRQRDRPADDSTRGRSPARSPTSAWHGDRASPGDRSRRGAHGPRVGIRRRDTSCNSARAGRRSRTAADDSAHGVPSAAITSGTKRRTAGAQVSALEDRTADRRSKVPEVYGARRLSGGVLLVLVVDGGRGERDLVEESKGEARSVPDRGRASYRPRHSSASDRGRSEPWRRRRAGEARALLWA
jgi:hypothetical protein